ncbi:MAG TPA: SDR family oxidoreductase [Methylococcaceae bacterium]|nr:SDR family oxidoreductase [Methylococcaceae bacterium]
MRILITGASGFIGGHVLHALLAAGHQVVAGVRQPDKFPVRDHCTALAMDFSRDTKPQHWLPRLHGVDAVVNCVGIIGEDSNQRFEDLHRRGPIALFQACVQAGVRKVIQISALGADETAFSRYHLSKKAADDFLAATGLEWSILQPSMVYGPGGKSLMLFSALAALPVTPLIGDGRQRLQPVHVDDLTAAVLRLLEPGAPNRVKLIVAGPESVTLAEMLTALRRWLGRRPAPAWPVPFRLVLMAGEIVGSLVASPLNGEALRMLQQGNTGDPSELTALLGRPPLSLDTALTRWPARQAECWHAGLLFLRPALRYALALLWIWSGLTSAWLFPQAESYALLAAIGVTGSAAPLALYGASALDVLLGLALLLRYRVKLAGAIQLGLMAVYSLVIGIFLP